MSLNTDHFLRVLDTLALAVSQLAKTSADDLAYDLYRAAAVKSFELGLETAVKLLRRRLKDFGGSPRAVDALTFKDVLRTAGKHALMTGDEIERWFSYRDNRNQTAHDYGVGFANATLVLLPDFMRDARSLADRLVASDAEPDGAPGTDHA